MSKIVPADRRSTGFQTHLERRFTPGRFGGNRLNGTFGNLGYQKRSGNDCRQFATASLPCGQHKKFRALQSGYFAHAKH